MEISLNDLVLYVDGRTHPGTVTIAMKKKFAKAHAEAVLEAIDNLPEEHENLVFTLAGMMVPKEKFLVSNIDYKEGDDANFKNNAH